jgi:hypothetical protein
MVEEPMTQEEYEQLQEEQGYIPDSVQQEEPGNLFTLFKRVLKLKDNSKVGNLGKLELGDLMISVRDCKKIALLAEQLGHQTFADFFHNQAEIILQTSASKKGWFVNLFVTSKRFSVSKMEEQIQAPQQQGGRRRWTWGNKGQ